MAFSADGEELFVAVPTLNHVKVVDSESLAIANTIAVGASPRALAFEPVPFVAPARFASPAPKRRR
jgi:DNA-binding beta-propeller fold protein YncE